MQADVGGSAQDETRGGRGEWMASYTVTTRVGQIGGLTVDKGEKGVRKGVQGIASTDNE